MARVTCNVYDANGPLFGDTLKLFMRLEIRADICDVLPAERRRLTPAHCVGDLPGLVLHGKQVWLAMMMSSN